MRESEENITWILKHISCGNAFVSGLHFHWNWRILTFFIVAMQRKWALLLFRTCLLNNEVRTRTSTTNQTIMSFSHFKTPSEKLIWRCTHHHQNCLLLLMKKENWRRGKRLISRCDDRNDDDHHHSRFPRKSIIAAELISPPPPMRKVVSNKRKFLLAPVTKHRE